jgi:hypothetical protein
LLSQRPLIRITSPVAPARTLPSPPFSEVSVAAIPAPITALLLLIPSIGFMLVVERFLKADVLAMVGR